MDRQNNNQPEQNTNQPQQSGTREQQNGGFPGLSGLLFPLNFIFGERQQDQTPNSSQSTAEDNSQQNGSRGQQPQAQQQIPQINIFIYPMPSTQEGDNTTPIFFFTPFFMPQEVRKPRASESAMKKLPIVIITEEHVNSQASCPICLEPLSLSTGQEENKVDDNKTITTETNKHETVRQMPCNHMFCESCLFQWLRQNNSCPLCRKEIEAEGTESQQQDAAAAAAPLNVPNVPLFGMTNSSTPISNDANANANANANTNNTNTNTNSHSHSFAHHSTISCALASVGCCEEIDNDTRTPIITLPQCHHRFHASCLRTSLLVEGYPPDDFNLISRPLNFRCPTCRAPAIVQSDVLKMTAVSHNEQQDRQGIPFNLPLTIHVPDSDDMDLD